MNERIKELAGKAGAKWHTDPNFTEKFAELIVRECIDIVKEDKRINWDDSVNLIDSIKDNFGVE